MLRILFLIVFLAVPPMPAVALPAFLKRCAERLLPRPKPPPLLSYASITEKLTDIENFWSAEFAKRGWTFRELTYCQYQGSHSVPGLKPGEKVVIDQTIGPCYNRLDQAVYLDPGWFHLAAPRLGAPSRTSLIVTLAHEFSHHIQELLKVNDRGLQEARARNATEDLARNYFSKRIEFQADCLAGIYLNALLTQKKLDSAETVESLFRVLLLGDDVQSLAAGVAHDPASPKSHGTAQERLIWFLAGLTQGQLERCEPFERPVLNLVH